MDRNTDMNGFCSFPPPYGGYEAGFDPNLGDGSMFNPVMQYEQAYMYYRYLTQQLEYKIKCKEYDKLCNTSNNSRTEYSKSDRN